MSHQSEWSYGCGHFFYSLSVSVYDGSELTIFEQLHGLMWSHMLIVMAFGHSLLVWQWSQYTYRLKQYAKIFSIADFFLSAAMMR